MDFLGHVLAYLIIAGVVLGFLGALPDRPIANWKSEPPTPAEIKEIWFWRKVFLVWLGVSVSGPVLAWLMA